MTPPAHPKVFISYSHDSPEHWNQVLALADRLLSHGIDTQIDLYESAPPEGWTRWMHKSIEKADFVLIICTETYKRSAEGREELVKGRGGDREGLIIDQAIYDSNGKNKKFIAVLLSEADRDFIPYFLRPYQSESIETDERYEKLYRRLTNQAETLKPPLGKIRLLPPRQRGTTAQDNASTSIEEAISRKPDIQKRDESEHIPSPILQRQFRDAPTRLWRLLGITSPGARKGVLNRLKDYLQTLEDDMLFERDGGKIFYLIDFVALHSYMWKSYAGGVRLLPEEPQESSYARQQVALGFLFSGRVKNLVLIPPYMEELSDHIESLRDKASIADLHVNSRVERLKILITQSPEFRNYLLAAKSFAGTEQGEKETRGRLRNAAVDLGKKYFPELYTIISCKEIDVLSTLQHIFEKRIVVQAGSLIEFMDDFGDESSIACSDRWAKQIAKKRHRLKPLQTQRDAMASAYLEIADSRLQKRGDKRLLVFVSSAMSVIHPLHAYEFRSVVTGLPRDPVRDLDFFWVRAVQPDVQSVRQSLDVVSRLLRILDAPQYAGEVEDIQQWRHIENLFLLTQRLFLEHSDELSERRVDNDFLGWLNAMNEASTDSRMLDSQRQQLFEGLRSKISQIEKMLPRKI